MSTDPRRYRHNATGLVYRLSHKGHILRLELDGGGPNVLVTPNDLLREYVLCDDAAACDESVNAAVCPTCAIGRANGYRADAAARSVAPDAPDGGAGRPAAVARVEGTGYVGSSGRDRDGVLRIAIDDSGDRDTWLTMIVDGPTARAFGARIGDRVRVTVEVIDDATETP